MFGISSPGFAILDSGCGKTIVGRETLNAFHLIWKQHGIPVKPEFKQRNVFRYGNGQQEISETMIDMPIFLASKPGYVRAAIVQGAAPLLLSRPSMKKLKVHMNFAEDSIQLFDSQVPVPMEVNSAGQYQSRSWIFLKGRTSSLHKLLSRRTKRLHASRWNIIDKIRSSRIFGNYGPWTEL